MIVSQLMWPPPHRNDKEEGASVQVHTNLLVQGGAAGDSAVSCVLWLYFVFFAGVWG